MVHLFHCQLILKELFFTVGVNFFEGFHVLVTNIVIKHQLKFDTPSYTHEPPTPAIFSYSPISKVSLRKRNLTVMLFPYCITGFLIWLYSPFTYVRSIKAGLCFFIYTEERHHRRSQDHHHRRSRESFEDSFSSSAISSGGSILPSSSLKVGKSWLSLLTMVKTVWVKLLVERFK